MNWIWNRLNHRDERGAVFVIAAAAIVLATVCAALAIDLGRIAQEERNDQKVADLAALDALRQFSTMDAAAKASAVRNGLIHNGTTYTVTAIEGTKNGQSCQPVVGSGKVCVVVTSVVEDQFRPGTHRVRAVAVAALDERAQLWVGSNAANFDASSSAVLNPVLSGFLGLNPPASLTAVGYQGLATGSISLREVISADATLGSPDQVLNGTVNMKKLALATFQALGNRPASDTAAAAARTALGNFASNVDTNLVVKLSDILGVQQPGDQSALDTQLNVFDLIMGAGQANTAARIATGTNFITVPGLTVGIPNLATSTLTLTVIEAPQISQLGRASCTPALTGPCETSADTAQIKIDLTTRIQVGIGCPGGLLCVVDLQLPISISAAKGTASLTDVRCNATPATHEADVRIDTAAATVSVTPVAQLSVAPAIPVPIPVTNLASATTSKTFSGPPFPTAIQSGSAQGLNLKDLFTGNPLLSAVLGVLNPVFDNIDALILDPLLKGLGLSIAGADVRVTQIICGSPMLIG